VVLGGQGGQNLANNGPAWSPDGNWIAFFRGDDGFTPSGLYVADLAGTVLWLVYEIPYGWSRGRRPSWSPNGRWIAYNANPGSNPADELFVIEVTLDEVTGEPESFGTPVQVTDTPDRTEWRPSWSPNSRALVAESFDTYGAADLIVLDLQLTPDENCLLAPCVIAETDITPGWMVDAQHGVWANDHDWIATNGTYLDAQGNEVEGPWIIDLTNPSLPQYFPLDPQQRLVSFSWDSTDQVLAFHKVSGSGKGKKNTSPKGLYTMDLDVTEVGGSIIGLSIGVPQLLVEGYAWTPAWRPCYPNCP
jgi:hypothetical protein